LWKLTLTCFEFYPVDCSLSLVSCKRVAETSLSTLHLRGAVTTRGSWALKRHDDLRSNRANEILRLHSGRQYQECGLAIILPLAGFVLWPHSGEHRPLRPCPRHASLRTSASLFTTIDLRHFRRACSVLLKHRDHAPSLLTFNPSHGAPRPSGVMTKVLYRTIPTAGPTPSRQSSLACMNPRCTPDTLASCIWIYTVPIILLI
jgi:hypothetical protein